VVIQQSFNAFPRVKIIPRKFQEAKLTSSAARLYNIFRAFRSRGPSRAIRFMYRGCEYELTTVDFLFQRELAAIVTNI
jgi:hypothetical protein